ncbi:ATP-binding protein [uncultured Rhodospira sp.]|uniref:ATP-binding protein n=1 Tax=uncultured Rhodospira sp. TaxID=1936189 RepID=UPI002626CCA5|nr:ATP-binding protein [uncultured Rhodospira sp.]
MKQLSLRTVFVVSAVVLILITGGAVGYLTTLNATIAVTSVTAALHREVSAQVVSHLRAFLDRPQHLLEQNGRLITAGIVDTDDQAALQTLFLEQVAVPSAATSLYFGNTRGGLAGAGHEGDRRTFYTTGTRGFTAGPFQKIEASHDGTRGEVVAALPGYDARERPWFKDALTRDNGAWNGLYVLFTRQDLALPASRAVRDHDGRLIGVLGVDLFVSSLSGFLADLHTRTVGVTYIMEPSGLLVASSTGERPFQVDATGTPTDRLSAADSALPEVAESARQILAGTLSNGAEPDPSASGSGMAVPRVGRATVAGEAHVVGVTPYEDPRGLSWLIATVVPVAAHQAPVVPANVRTLILTALAVAAIAIVATVLIRRALAPLAEVADAATAVGRGDLPRTLPERGTDEIGALARTFNEMVARLRAAQAQQQRQVSELADAENRFRSLFQNAEVAICNEDLSGVMATLEQWRAEGIQDLRAHLQADPDRLQDLAARVRVIETNPATMKLLDLDPDTPTVPNIADHFVATTWDRFIDKVCALWNAEPQFRLESRIRTARGNERTVLFSMPVPRTLAQARIVPVSMVDLTERNASEEALARKNEELERSNAELESFAHVAAHDLREPLRTIASYATLLRRRTQDRLTDEEAEFVAYINQGVARMDALISDLLDFARVGRSDKARSAVALAGIVTDAIADLRPAIDAAGAEITVAEDLPTVFGHADELLRVFINILGNAVKYRRPDQPLRVEIGGERMPDTTSCGVPMCQVFVRDNGIGLPPGEGQEDRIFRLFQRLHPQDAFGGGTGIGLAICKKAIEHHGGRIWAESPGETQGCTIRFTLPMA